MSEGKKNSQITDSDFLKLDLRKQKVLLLVKQKFEDILEKQLSGEQIDSIQDKHLKNLSEKISTDGILPTKATIFYKSLDLANYALSGVSGISEQSIMDNQYQILVVGEGFGGGSSREHAALALKGAGIKLIIATGKVERIFKENCLNIGGPIIHEIEGSTQEINQILADIRENKKALLPIPYSDPIRRAIFRAGGLFEFTKQRLKGEVDLPIVAHRELKKNHPLTAAEKILVKNSLNVDPDIGLVEPGDIIVVKPTHRFSYEIFAPMIESYLEENLKEEKYQLDEIESISLFEDHSVCMKDAKFEHLRISQRAFAQKHSLKLYLQKNSLEGSQGICHTLALENVFAGPGEVLIGTDSHTCTSGVTGSFALGIGASNMACAFLKNETIIEVPQTIKVEFAGSLPSYCTAKDVMLTILSHPYVKEGNCIGKILEYSGEGLTLWDLDELLVLTNMAVETGATTGIVTEPTRAVISHLQKVRNLNKEEILKQFEQIRSDADANYAQTLSLNLSTIKPMVALPHHPSNGIPVLEKETISINKAFIGSCTGGNLTDLRQAAEILKNVKKIKTKLTIQPASMKIFNQAKKEGLLDIFEKIGAQILMPGCGACCGLGPGGVSSSENCVISTTNRNFPGRMGKVKGEPGKIYLAGAKVLAASCITGEITDPRKLNF